MRGFADNSKRSSGGAKRFDLTDLRKALADHRVMPAIGVVYQPQGEPSHYDLEPDQSGNGTDVLVYVMKMPNEEPLLCYLAGGGIWRIPPVGTAVVLLIPDGDLDAGATIVGMLSSGAPPAALDGDTAVCEVPKINFKATGGDAEIDASGSVKLGGGTDPAAVASSAFETWIGQVETAINTLAPGSIAPLLASDTTHKSAKVKA